ncbi:hypothetical protein VP01_2961g4 [Puccinia sorghi]|uniref:BD-FAE-like domain-containing protein n=1 Tax=Puccinia sorghi TaxID=27349 RepID=A0A0L6V0X4_9BASI|nr:hypothetical protein VP01_2961g4 [Puccinia sorghi]
MSSSPMICHQEAAPPPINPSGHPRLRTFLLCLLLPTLLLCSLLSPVSLLFSLLPFTVVVALPICLSSTILHVYYISPLQLLLIALAWFPYLLFAQDDLPSNTTLLLPISPMRILRIRRWLTADCNLVTKHVIMALRSNWLQLILDYSYRKMMVVGRNRRRHSQPTLVVPEIIYAYADQSRRSNKRLDVYLPPSFSSESHEQSAAAPVILFCHPGGWRWFNKALFLQLGLRLRRLGFCVVIPDFVYSISRGKMRRISPRHPICVELGVSIHRVKKISVSITPNPRPNLIFSFSHRQYGGDPDRIFLAGHGSGAHLALLTVLKNSIVRSAEEYDASDPVHDHDLPHIEGMILLSGIYDPVDQLRAEARHGCHEFLALRRALGPSHATTLAHSPNHLLHHYQFSLRPRHLPEKFLIIHGGQDRNVGILQSHVLSTLLDNINRQGGTGWEEDHSLSSQEDHEGTSKGHVHVRFVPLKHLDHLGTLFSLLFHDPNSNRHHPNSPYPQLIIDEILGLVA